MSFSELTNFYVLNYL